MPVKHDLRQSNNTFPYSRSRKRKAESLTVILEPSLFDLATSSSVAIVCRVFRHKLPWSMEGNTKIQSEAKDKVMFTERLLSRLGASDDLF